MVRNHFMEYVLSKVKFLWKHNKGSLLFCEQVAAFSTQAMNKTYKLRRGRLKGKIENIEGFL